MKFEDLDLVYNLFLFSLFVDDRRMKIVEMGGAQELVNMLGDAKDDRTRKEALKALSALSHSGQISVLILHMPLPVALRNFVHF